MAFVVSRLLLFQSLENLARRLQQVRVVAAILQFQRQRKPVFAAAQHVHGLLPIDGASFPHQRKEVVGEGGTIDWKKAMELLRSGEDRFPLALELKDRGDNPHLLETACQVFERLEEQ